MEVAESETRGRDEGRPQGDLSLDTETKLPSSSADGCRFQLNVYPESGEFTVSRVVGRIAGRRNISRAPDTQRSARSAIARARSRIRRYAAEHGLRFMWTLTYATEQHDPARVLRDVERLVAKVAKERGGQRFPYVRVLELHKSGHGIHVHMGVPFWFAQADLAELWGKGFVWCSDKKPKGAAVAVGARVAARYLSKYVGKAFEVTEFGRHRYECAQGFGVTSYRFLAKSMDDGISDGLSFFPSGIAHFWASTSDPSWLGPPVVAVQCLDRARGPSWQAALALHGSDEADSHVA